MSGIRWYRPESWRFAASSLDHPLEAASQDLRRPEWVIWPPWRPPVEVTSANGREVLDAFCRIARSEEAWPRQRRAVARRRLDAMSTFVERYGPWAYCRDGHIHPPYDARSTTGPTSAGRRPPVYFPADDRGVSALEVKDGPGGQRLVKQGRRIGAQWLPDLFASTVAVNALRAVVASVSRGAVADAILWDRLLGTGRLRAATKVDTPLDQEATAQWLLGRWLAAEHVEVDEAGNGYASGPAGALALALRNEAIERAPVGVCDRCDVAWRPGRQRDGGGVPELCPRCADYERLNEWRSSRGDRPERRPGREDQHV